MTALPPGSGGTSYPWIPQTVVFPRVVPLSACFKTKAKHACSSGLSQADLPHSHGYLGFRDSGMSLAGDTSRLRFSGLESGGVFEVQGTSSPRTGSSRRRSLWHGLRSPPKCIQRGAPQRDAYASHLSFVAGAGVGWDANHCEQV